MFMYKELRVAFRPSQTVLRLHTQVLYMAL
jgi:hypothetical protein